MEKFEVIPAIDLRGGRCVQLRQGKKEAVIVSSAENPVEIARNWVTQGATRLHIIDLDGAFQARKNNFEVIKNITESEGVRGKAKIQVGGGIRSYDGAVKLLKIGSGIGVAATEAAKQAQRMGAGSLLFTNIDVEGLMKGIERKIVEEFVSAVSVPVVIAGGVSNTEDVMRIKEAGACGVVIGSALYKGEIDLYRCLGLAV